MVGLLDELVGLFTGVEGFGNVAIGVRNGGLELVCFICSNIPIVFEKVLVSSFFENIGIVNSWYVLFPVQDDVFCSFKWLVYGFRIWSVNL
jgi:hypothetical protein